MLKDKVEAEYRFGTPMRALITINAFLAQLVDAVAVFFYRGLSLWCHMDAYNLSVLVGKVLNICYQLYAGGWAFRHWGDRWGV